MKSTTPEAPTALPLEGASLADRQSRIRGGCLATTLLATAVAMRKEQ
jgi:hypothetical protein